MKILVACIHYPVASGRYIERAFKRLGHDVRTTGPETGNKIWGMEVATRWIWTPDFQPGDDWTPDLIINADSHYALDWRPNPPCPRVMWGVDNHARDYRFEVEFDVYFLAHTWGARMGEPNVYWLPPCYDSEAHSDLHVERDLDVVCIGYPYGERVEIMQALAASGLRVVMGLGPLWDEYNALYNRAKIGFNKSAMGDISQRIFENMAQGCCVLTDEPRDLPLLGFEPTRDYIPYTSAQDAVEKARQLIGNGQWKEIALAGQRKVSPHIWDARATKLLQTMGLT